MKRPHCPIKGHERVYFEAYDMLACLECDAWLSDACGCQPAERRGFRKPPRDPSMVTDCKPEAM